MAATLHGVDVVGECQDSFGETLVVLERNLHGVSVDLALDVQRPKVHPTFVAIQILDERADPALEVEGVLEVDPLIAQHNRERLVEEGELAQAMRHDVPVEAELLEDLWIRPEPNVRPCGIGLAAGFLFDRLAGPSWLARQFSGSTRGIVTSALVGIAGALIGYHIAVLLALGGGIVTSVIAAAVGATVVLFAWRMAK